MPVRSCRVTIQDMAGVSHTVEVTAATLPVRSWRRGRKQKIGDIRPPRVRRVLENRWDSAGKPAEGWIWPALTRSGRVEPSSFRKHVNAFKTMRKSNPDKSVRPFVLYSLPHTFLTRLGESGCDAWTLARIAGHSNVSMSSRYVHPSENAVLDAMERLGGHKTGHTQMG